MHPTGRPYRGAADLRRMQELVSRSFAATSMRVGDLAWLARHHTHRELSLDIRLWEDSEGALVGFTFYRSRGGFNVFVAPGHGQPKLFDEMLGAIDEIDAASLATGDAPVALYTYGVAPSRSSEDRLLAEALERHGFGLDSTSTDGVMTHALVDVPTPPLPPGYRLGWIDSRATMLGRVAAQQAAFAPSDLIAEKYERLQRTWPYRPTLDRVVLADDGVVVSFCTAWLDEANAAGLLEPVGTLPSHQRRGLAKAVCADALRALREAGARTAQIGWGTEAAHATYRSIGFVDAPTERVYSREPRVVSTTE